MTATQVRQVVVRLIAAGHWRPGDPDMLIVFDAGYDVTRLAWQLTTSRSRWPGGCARTGCCTSRRRPAPPAAAGGSGTARIRAGGPGDLARAAGRHQHRDLTDGTAVAAAWDRLHPPADPPRRLAGPRLQHCPVIDGTLIRLQVDHLPGQPQPPAGMAVGLAHPRHL